MELPPGLVRRARRVSALALAAGFALAAVSLGLVVFAYLRLQAAHRAMMAGGVPSTQGLQVVLDLATLASHVAVALVLLGAVGHLLAGLADVSTRRRALLLAPALLGVAVVFGPLLWEYAGAIGPTDPLRRAPLGAAVGLVVAVLVGRGIGARSVALAGGALLVAGALHNHLRDPYWAGPLDRLPSQAVEAAWAGAGLLLLAFALALHAARGSGPQREPEAGGASASGA